MSSFQQFEHLHIPLADLKSITNDFSDECIIGKDGFWFVYKGQLLHGGQLMNVAIKRLVPKYGQGTREFLTDIVTRSSLNHENLVSLVGFCDEDGEKIIIDKHEVNESLDRHLSNPSLTWMQRLRVCVSVARLLSYIHSETGYSYDVIHRDFKSTKVLLDENWEAKVGGFGLSIKTPATRRHRLVLEAACGTLGYMDPTYLKSGSVTHKSDVYSFGVVLFEVLCGRKVFVGKDTRDALIPIARQAYESRTLDDIINPNMLKQMQPESLTIFSETAYHCIMVQRTQRPDMKRVVERLEKAMQLQWKHENPVPKETPSEGTSSNYFFKGKGMELLKIGFDAIKVATEDFAKKYVIGRGGFGTVYRAELEHFDSSIMKGELESEFPKTRSIVAIKHIREHTIGEQGFITEVETLAMCKHPNIVSLLGFCYEHPHMFLVYEYVCNGSLEDYLGSEAKMTNLTWVQRIQICIDIACGLDYLHTASENKKKIIHRDIKSANILLDASWEAKIADFGLSKFHHAKSTLLTKNIAGTQYYTDPEYAKTGKLKKATDIYSFGVVLFEILFGRLAYDPLFTRENEKGLAPVARRHFEEGTIKELLDPKLMEETDIFAHSRLNQNSLHTFTKIAYQCLEESQAQRPEMEEVISELRKALEVQVMHEETDKSKDVQQDLSLRSKVDQVQQLPTKNEIIFDRSQNFDDCEKLNFVREVNKKKQLMHSAKAALCNFSDSKNFRSKPSTESSFQEVIELLPQQVFRINCRINSQMLSTDTTYYLVFKLSDKSQGFHCPVEIRDLLHRENKETDIIYFVSPSPWNIHDFTRVPEQREDGWMEVNVWKFNSSDELENDCIFLNLKLASYEGTMSGLIVCGLEFRPV